MGSRRPMRSPKGVAADHGVAGRWLLRRAGGRRRHGRSWSVHAEGLDVCVDVAVTPWAGRSVGAVLRPMALDDCRVARASPFAAFGEGRRPWLRWTILRRPAAPAP